jgi:hypothetical protein
MGTHTCIVSRAGSNASDTSTAAAFAWQVGAGSGSNPVNATDFPGGTFPSGTGTVAAGAASATITFQSNPDTTFEPDETGVLTVSTTQNGVTIIGSPQPFTITNDDADPGSGGGDTIVYGPTTTTDTTFVQTGASTHRITGKLADVAVFTLRIASNATGTDGIRWEYQGFNTWRLILVTGGTDDVIQTGSVNPTGNPDFTFEQSGGRLKMVAGGATVFDRPDAGKTGTYARAQISSPGQPITITRLAS